MVAFEGSLASPHRLVAGWGLIDLDALEHRSQLRGRKLMVLTARLVGFDRLLEHLHCLVLREQALL